MIIKVDEKSVGKRLDSFISISKNELSRNTIQRLIEEENINVNGNKTKASYKVKINDEIEIIVPKAKEIELKAQNIPIQVLYEDNDIIVVNKPKGMVVHPANR